MEPGSLRVRPCDWLGLGFQQEEPYRLARIRVGLPYSSDIEVGLPEPGRICNSCSRRLANPAFWGDSASHGALEDKTARFGGRGDDIIM